MDTTIKGRDYDLEADIMHVFKELSFVGDKTALDNFKTIAPSFAHGEWKYITSKRMRNYIAFDYLGSKVDQAEVSIYYGTDSWRGGSIKVGNIVPLQKDRLTIDEYNAVLDLFYAEIIIPNASKLSGITIIEPTSDQFAPLDYISEEALLKLTRFCLGANKSTGSSHPDDERRWYDFICQTVDDNRTFDYETLYRFLKDEEYWGKKDKDFIGVMGHFAWDEEHAAELASEYNDYVRFLQFYLDKKWHEKHEEAQK